MYDPNAVKIYTDGSSRPNPGKGGIGMVVEFPDSHERPNLERSTGYVHSNNNRMELRAVILAIQWLRTNAPIYRFTRAQIITDSKYVHDNHTKAQYWKDDGWCTKEGKPYENRDLWDTLLKEKQKLKLSLSMEWTKGKQSTILDRVDQLAKAGVANPIETDYGYSAGKHTATRTGSKKAALSFPADGQTELIRVYRKNVYGKNEGMVYKIAFDLYDQDKKEYSQKFVAYYRGGGNDMKRNNCYRVLFNSSKRFPVMIEVNRVDYLK